MSDFVSDSIDYDNEYNSSEPSLEHINEPFPETEVTYSTQIIDHKHKNWRKTITHKRIDNYDFSEHFIEILDKPEYVRPFFDFDEISNPEEYSEVLEWLNSLTDKYDFGPFAIGGYTSIPDFPDKCKQFLGQELCNLKYIEKAHHLISIHVVFYSVKMKSTTLIRLMKQNNKQYQCSGINRFCDPNVYKLNTRQLMRHVLSDKYFNKNNHSNAETAGTILLDSKPSDLIITPTNKERELTEIDLSSFFLTEIETKCKKTCKKLSEDPFGPVLVSDSDSDYDYDPVKPVPVKPVRTKSTQQLTVDDIEYVDGIIEFTKNQLIEFIERLGIENNTTGILVQLAPLYSSPFSKQFLIEAIEEWYTKQDHDHPENVSKFIDRYYKYSRTNKWFYSLLKRFGTDEIRSQYSQIQRDHIDMTINVNNSNLTFDDIKERKYSIQNVPRLLNDLRGVIGNIDDKWYLKTIKNGQRFIVSCSDDQIRAKTKTTKPFRMNTKINVYQIISKYSDTYRYRTATIQKDNSDEHNINLFQGFKYQELQTDNFEPIQMFLDHIKTVICRNNEEKFQYFLKWWANIVQNICVKNGTMPIIYGGQGSGKSFVVETFCELFGNYALCNVDDLDKVFGKFNGLIGRNLVININEPPEAGDKFTFNGKIKSKLTQKRIVQETKGMDQIEIDSFANYILTTNSYCPIKEEKGNRRMIYFETDNSMCGNKEYFDKLCKPIQPTKQGDYNSEFMGTLLHYLLTRVDVSDFDPEQLIRKINSETETEYNEQLERQYADCSAVDRFVIDHFQDFETGIDTDYIRNNMNTLPAHTVNSVSRALNTICTKKRIMKNGHKLTVYQLKPAEQIQDLYNIIRYRVYNELTEPSLEPVYGSKNIGTDGTDIMDTI